ncbi:DNA primase family protein [Paracoccus endophyticus]|uniref:DNA primase family protein n=1 Tax=Paracoccus endophyticus TaxID=2233774 RepID=UPI000DDBE58A|nr:phage/plasmid primase, P4 family [Paracoccus endophyticus]
MTMEDAQEATIAAKGTPKEPPRPERIRRLAPAGTPLASPSPSPSAGVGPTPSPAIPGPLQPLFATGVGVHGQALAHLAYADLADLAFAANVPCVPKEDAGWFIPSALGGADARSHAAQRERGAFGALVLDIDDGGHSLDDVERAVQAAVGEGVNALIYTTKSATAVAPKWRAVIALAAALPGADYAETAEALCELIEQRSGGAVRPDRAMCRAGQIAFLPNLPDGDAPFYQRRQTGGDPLALGGDHPIIALRDRRRRERAEAEAAAAADRERRRVEREASGTATLIERFNRAHPLPDLLHSYEYLNRDDGSHGWSEHWRSPYQKTGSHATQVRTDDAGGEYWISLSASDAGKGLGRKCASGRWGDAFDLFVHYEHGGNEAAAREAWQKACDDARHREAAEKLARIAVGGGEGADGAAPTDGDPDPAVVERLTALCGVRTDDASLALGWLAEEGDRLVLCDDGFWRRFEGGHWQRLDDAGARKALGAYLRDVGAMRLAAAEAKRDAGEIGKEVFEKVEKLEAHLRTSAKRRAVFEQARDEATRIAADAFDAEPMLFGLPGGRVADLRTAEVREGRPEDRISLSAAEGPAPQGVVPERWLRFIDQIADGRPGWATFLQRLAGYCLTGSTSAKAFFFLQGGGDNGKSVYREVLKGLLGSYAKVVSVEVLLRPKGGGTQHPTGLASLAGARMVTVTEPEAGRVWNDALVKDVTGGDTVTARHMNRDFFDFTPRATILVNSNPRPSFATADEAMVGRTILMEFRRKFEKHEQVPDFRKLLLAEEGPAILRWAIEGARDWHAAGGGREGLVIPDDVAAAGRRYADEEDVVRQFLLDQQHRNPEGWAPGAFFKAPDLYPEFERWAKGAGMKPWTRRTFEKALSEGADRYGLCRERTEHARGYTVERLLADEDAEGSEEPDAPAGDGDARVVGLRKALRQNRGGAPDNPAKRRRCRAPKGEDEGGGAGGRQR